LSYSSGDTIDYIDKISPVDQPEFESAADLCFAHAIELFEDGHYDDSADQFREAIRISPEDIILPFTYSQALFAKGDYAHAAGVLRGALAGIPEDELTIYYPRGLYTEEEDLLEQIVSLEKAIKEEPFAADYNLLLGYQYLGMGELDKATEPLALAAIDPANEQAAGMLMELATKLEEETSVEE
jgi:tetratricopeptide (TPR) repeat protein